MEETKIEKVPCKQVTNFDDAFTQVGCASVQLKQHLLFFLMCVPFACQSLIVIFSVEEPEWRCVANSTSCVLEGTFGPESFDYEKRCQIKRSEWEYVTTNAWSLVTEFDLVCDKAVLVNVSGSAFFFGAVFGALLFGWAADRFGRIKVLWLSLILAQTASSVASVSPNIWVYTGLRLANGFFFYGVALSMTILCCEFVGPAYRAMSSVSLWIYFSVGLIILGLKAYFIRNWKLLNLVCSLPYLLVFLFYRFIPESVRWLWVTGQEKECQQIISKIAKLHSKSPISLDSMESKTTSGPLPSFKKLFNSRKMLTQTLIQGYLWFVQGLLYYGFFLVSENLSGKLYQDFILTSLMDIPAILFAMYCGKRLKRKTAFLGSILISSLSSVGLATMASTEHEVLTYTRLGLGLIGKFFVATASNLLYIWSPEIYPTVVRSKAMGIFSALRPFGGAVAPWVTTLLIVYHSSLPFAVLAALSSVQIFMCFALPETKGQQLLDNFTEQGKVNEGFTKEMVPTDLCEKDLALDGTWQKDSIILEICSDKECEMTCNDSKYSIENNGFQMDEIAKTQLTDDKPGNDTKERVESTILDVADEKEYNKDSAENHCECRNNKEITNLDTTTTVEADEKVTDNDKISADVSLTKNYEGQSNQRDSNQESSQNMSNVPNATT